MVFGEAADSYDRVRPGYPGVMVDEILAEAGAGPVLEVGAGTGKATRLFAERGADLTCVEPDARMAAVLRRNVPGVRVVESSFEQWNPDRAYGLLFSAQAWHWVDPAVRAERAARALAPGGLFAPFWNGFFVTDPALHAALAEVDARHGMADDHTSHRLPVADRTPPREFDVEWADLGLTAGRFPEREGREYESTLSYSAERYREYLISTSVYRLLEPAAADAVLDDVAAVVDAHGGAIEFLVVTAVALARRG
jgi:SAM-dependent methyltransferase